MKTSCFAFDIWPPNVTVLSNQIIIRHFDLSLFLVHECGLHKATVTLTFDLHNLTNSTLSQGEHLCEQRSSCCCYVVDILIVLDEEGKDFTNLYTSKTLMSSDTANLQTPKVQMRTLRICSRHLFSPRAWWTTIPTQPNRALPSTNPRWTGASI